MCNQCDDGTQEAATRTGALVLEQNVVAGKGQTLKVGLDYVETKRVMFCDADLRGPIGGYVTDLAAPGYSGLVIGVPDFPVLSPVPWRVPRTVFAKVSGQRSLPIEVARSVELHGYTVEVMLNRAIELAGLSTRVVQMKGVKGKIRNNGRRMAELRRDQQWLRENWK